MLAYSYEQWHSRRPQMAAKRLGPFSDDPASDRRPRPLDERMLLRGAVSMYHEQDLLDEDASVLRTLGYRIYIVDAARFTTTGAFHSKIRLMLEVRRRYEETLDGFASALRDLESSPRGRTAIVFHGFDVFARQCRTLAKQVLDRIDAQSRRSLIDGRRFLALLQSSSATLAFEPTEAASATWNEREFPRPSGVPQSGIHVRRPVPVFADEAMETLVQADAG